jgi:flagellar biosynthetic protein FliR
MLDVTLTQFVLFLLLFVRVTALMVVAPVVGHQVVPVQVKLALSAFLAIVVLPLASAHAPALDVRLGALILLALKEAVMGAAIGFLAGLLFLAVRGAGELVGFELGFSISTIFDPESGQNNTVVGEMFYLLMALLFLSLNGLHFVVQALVLSYEVVPVGGIDLQAAFGERLIALCGSTVAIAVKIAAPVIVSGFLMNLALAILTRVAPQMNVFLLSFPVKIIAGLVVLMAAAPMMVYVFKNLLTGFEENILDLVRVL